MGIWSLQDEEPRSGRSRDQRTATPRPRPRGPLSTWTINRIAGRPTLAVPPPSPADLLTDDDAQLAMHCLHELEYRAVEGARASVELDPLLIGLRIRLDQELLAAVDAESERHDGARWADLARRRGADVAVDAMLADFAGPSLSSFMDEHGTRRHFHEFMIHRSAYQLKEADPHTFGLARLQPGPRKSAYAEIQFDEYGNGEDGATHAQLFAAAMRQSGLDGRYGRYVDLLPAPTLATSNLLNLFASRRQLLAPLVGHLALFEMTSVTPMGRYARAARRLELGPDVERFYDVHVVADEHHGDLARRVLLGDRSDDLDPAGLVFGAHALLCVEDRFARNLLDGWERGGSALLAGTGGDDPTTGTAGVMVALDRPLRPPDPVGLVPPPVEE